MIRFVDLGRQIHSGDPSDPRSFAFWNTVTDRFVEVGGQQAWESREDFELSVRCDHLDERLVVRLREFIPLSWPADDPDDDALRLNVALDGNV